MLNFQHIPYVLNRTRCAEFVGVSIVTNLADDGKQLFLTAVSVNMMNSSVFSAVFSQESSFWSAFGDINKFDVQRNMYNYGTVRKYFKRLQRMYERRVNPLDSIKDPEKIKEIFRLYPHRIIQLAELLKRGLECNTKCNNSLSVLTQVGTVLYYYGSGRFLFYYF